MNKAFRRGLPRKGQWVILDGKDVGVVADYDHGLFQVHGDHITRHPDREEIKAARKANPLLMGNPEMIHVALVDGERCVATGKPDCGLHDLAQLLVNVERLTPILDKQQIPKARRDTLAEGWAPLP